MYIAIWFLGHIADPQIQPVKNTLDDRLKSEVHVKNKENICYQSMPPQTTQHQCIRRLKERIYSGLPGCLCRVRKATAVSSEALQNSTLEIQGSREFVQQVTLGTSNILILRFPFPRTLTNHIDVSNIGGPKVLFYRRMQVLSIGQLHWSGYVNACIHLIGRSVIQLRAVIFSNACLLPPLVGPFSLLVASPYSFLDVGLDFQASKMGQRCEKRRAASRKLTCLVSSSDNCCFTVDSQKRHC